MSESRVPRLRRFLVCEPRHFAVQYAINPWMNPDTRVDVDLAQEQWTALIDAYRAHGTSTESVPSWSALAFNRVTG
ncbi:amidinotransferase, partial [Streptomyces sp. NPDC007162]